MGQYVFVFPGYYGWSCCFVRFLVDGANDDEGIVEHLTIKESIDQPGKIEIEGEVELIYITISYCFTVSCIMYFQDSVYSSIVEAVNSYTRNRNPPLTPALGKREKQHTYIHSVGVSVGVL